MNNLVSISIKSEFENVSLVGTLVHHIAKFAGMTNEESARTELAVVEAVNNVIEHAYQMQDDHQLEVSCSISEHDQLEIRIFDTGIAMDVRLLSADTTPQENIESIDALQTGGWGLSLIREIMDEVTYQTDGGRNCITLKKAIKS